MINTAFPYISTAFQKKIGSNVVVNVPDELIDFLQQYGPHDFADQPAGRANAVPHEGMAYIGNFTGNTRIQLYKVQNRNQDRKVLFTKLPSGFAQENDKILIFRVPIQTHPLLIVNEKDETGLNNADAFLGRISKTAKIEQRPIVSTIEKSEKIAEIKEELELENQIADLINNASGKHLQENEIRRLLTPFHWSKRQKKEFEKEITKVLFVGSQEEDGVFLRADSVERQTWTLR